MPKPKCTEIPDHATQVEGIGESAVDVEATLYATNEAASAAEVQCTYVCEPNYTINGDICEENAPAPDYEAKI